MTNNADDASQGGRGAPSAGSGWGAPPGQAQQPAGSGWGPPPGQAGGWQAPAGATNRKAQWQKPAAPERSLTAFFFKPPPGLSDRARPVHKLLTVLSLPLLIPMFLLTGVTRRFPRRVGRDALVVGGLGALLLPSLAGTAIAEVLGAPPALVVVPLTLVLAAPLILRYFLPKLMP